MDVATATVWMRRAAWVVATICALGLVIELIHFGLDWHTHEGVVALFSLSEEYNLPTFVSSQLAAACALACALWAARDPARHRPLVGLAVGFTFISFDEIAQLHEQLGGHFGGEGWLHYDWVIPGAIVVAVLGGVFVPFLYQLPPVERRRVTIAGGIYVAAALGLELPLGHYAAAHGVDNLAYALLDWVEEAGEMLGLTLFLRAVVLGWPGEIDDRVAPNP